MDASIRPPAARLRESTTGTAGTAAPCSPGGPCHAVGKPRRCQWACCVVDQHHLGTRFGHAGAHGIGALPLRRSTIGAVAKPGDARLDPDPVAVRRRRPRPCRPIAPGAMRRDGPFEQRPTTSISSACLSAAAHPRAASRRPTTTASAKTSAPATGSATWLSEDHPAGDRLQHAHDGHLDLACRACAPPPSTTIIVPSSRIGQALAGLLALLDDLDAQRVAGQERGLERVGQLVEVEHADVVAAARRG